MKSMVLDAVEAADFQQERLAFVDGGVACIDETRQDNELSVDVIHAAIVLESEIAMINAITNEAKRVKACKAFNRRENRLQSVEDAVIRGNRRFRRSLGERRDAQVALELALGDGLVLG
jgi:hypothetical protein